MPKLIFLRGPSGSGKSTYATKKAHDDNGKTVRVNKDTLREMLHGGRWSRDLEKYVLSIQELIVKTALLCGKDVILDNTHIGSNHEEVYREIASNLGADFQLKIFDDVSFDECVRRDSLRFNPVGKKVIKDQWKRMYGVDPTLPKKVERPPFREGYKKAVAVDLDGTLAEGYSHRSPYDYTKVINDVPQLDVWSCVKALADKEKADILFVSGRDSSCHADTKAWIYQYLIGDSGGWGDKEDEIHLFMRPEGDKRPDNVIKGEIHDKFLYPNWDIVAVFDDRNRVVDLWRSLGYRTYQVAPGDF